MVLSTSDKNVMDRVWDERRSFNDNRNYKEIDVNNQNESDEILGTYKEIKMFNSQDTSKAKEPNWQVCTRRMKE